MKRCNKCLIEKDENCFWKDKNNPTSLNNVCKECWSEYRRAKWVEKQKDFHVKKEEERKKIQQDLKNGYKKCNHCKNLLPLDHFYGDKYTKDGYTRRCKKCYGGSTPEEIKEHKKEKIKFLETNIKTCSKCKIEKPLSDFGKRRKALCGISPRCKSCENIINTEKRRKNIERVRELNRKNRNTDKYRAKQREQDRKRRQRPDVKISQSFSRRIRKSIGKNKSGCHWENLVGYTTDQLKAHLEKLFKPGMTWDNYGLHGWHIDHIRPVSSFNITTYDCEDFRKCWALENLQPLWAKDNRIKSNKIHLPDMTERVIDDSALEVL